MAARRDSFGFPLASLMEGEAAARARCLAGGAAASLANSWSMSSDMIDNFARNPTAAPPKKLKVLARAGMPPAQRSSLWLRLSGGTALQAAAPPAYYDTLVREADTAASPKSVISRAELELHNPFPGHALLSSIKGMRAVRRVVLAHAAHTGTPEYSQGLCSVAAFLLAVMGMGREEDTFWTLDALVRNRLHPGFFEEMRGCRVEQRVLEELVQRKTPRVAALFAAAETPLSEVTAEWMAYLFTRSLPSEAAARVFDCLVVEGGKALHRAGVALFRLHESPLVSTCKGSQRLGTVLRWRVARTYDTDLLAKMQSATKVQSATICALRASHEAALAADRSALASRLRAIVHVSPSASASPSYASSGSLAAAGDAAAAAAAPAAEGVNAPAPRGGASLAGLLPRHQSPPELFKVASLRLLLAGGAR